MNPCSIKKVFLSLQSNNTKNTEDMSNVLYQFSPHGRTKEEKEGNLYLRLVGGSPTSNLKCYTADQLPSGITFHIRKKKYKTAKGFLRAVNNL